MSDFGCDYLCSRRNLHLTLAFLFTALACGGCGRNSNAEPVSGTVSFLEQPLPSAVLMFFPGSGRPLTATTDTQGNYTLQLPPGEYKVTISISAELPPGWKEGDTVPPPKIKLPDQYGQRVRTPLSATVAEGQSEPINFTVK